eukprot:tig00020610_g11962.t1
MSVRASTAAASQDDEAAREDEAEMSKQKGKAPAPAAPPARPADEGLEELAILQSLVESDEPGPALKAVFERGVHDTFLEVLNAYIAKKDTEIQELCNSHYQEFIRSVDDLSTARKDVRNLKRAVVDLDQQLQESGRALLKQSEALLEGRKIKRNLAAAIGGLQEWHAALALLARAAEHARASKPYLALRALGDLQRAHLPKLSPYPLARTLEARVAGMTEEVRRGIMSSVVEWLVRAREAAREVGATALRAGSAADATAAPSGRPASAPKAGGSGVSRPASLADMAAAVSEDEAALEAAAGAAAEAAGAALRALDLTPLHEAIHVFEQLGARDELRAMYASSRRGQAEQDVEPPSGPRLLASRGGYFSLAAGFFIVERTVLKATTALLSPADLAEWWEAVAGRLAASLAEAAAGTEDPAALAALKEEAALLGAALEGHAYNVSRLLEALDASRARFLTLTLGTLRPLLDAAMAGDDYEPVVLRSREHCEVLVVGEGLLLPEDADAPPASFPAPAGFSASVPTCVAAVRSALSDYGRYARHVNDSMEALRRALDELLSRGLNEAAGAALAGIPAALGAGFRAGAQLSLNLAFFAAACAPLDKFAFTLSSSQRYDGGVGRNGAPGGRLAARDAFLETKASAEMRLYDMVYAAADAHVARAALQTWTPSAPSGEPAEYVRELAEYLEDALRAARRLSPAVCTAVHFAAFTRATTALLELLGGPQVKRFNAVAVANLEADVALLEGLAARSGVPHLTDVFEPLRQVLRVFGPKGEFYTAALLDEQKRAMFFSHAPLPKLVPILAKYRESGVKVVMSALSRTSLDAVLRKLKAMKLT